MQYEENKAPECALPSCPGLTRPSTSLFPKKQDVDARDRRWHDERRLCGNANKKAPVETGA
jgi:hypothetical protein